MNYWLVAFLSLIFTAVCGTLAVNSICNHVIDVYSIARWGVNDEKKISLKLILFAERLAAVMLCGLTASGLACLIFSVIKLIGG